MANTDFDDMKIGGYQSPYQPGQLIPMQSPNTIPMYPGLQPLGTNPYSGTSTTAVPMVDVNALLAMINDLQLKVKELEEHRVHIDVSKNQEERIMELEECVAELLTEKADRETKEAERKKAEDAKKTDLSAQLDALRYTAMAGSAGFATTTVTSPTATQAQMTQKQILEQYAMKQMKEEMDK